MICFYLLWTLGYLLLLAVMAAKWPRSGPESFSGSQNPPVTLLIPLRNEAENLAALAAEIRKITYPKLEILLVDDGSEDGTFARLGEMAKADPRIEVLRSPGLGKKEAVTFGLKRAGAELILCTDADCSFPELWVENRVAAFADPKVQLVAGPVMSAGQAGFFQRFQQIEWASILLMTQFFFSQKKPLMCSAANLAYRKSAFLEVGGYEGNLQHPSGDDEFLLKKIAGRFGSKACLYLPFVQNLVFTQPQESLAELVSQRVRWAGKWRLHGGWSHGVSALLSFLAQLLWLGSGGLLWLGNVGVLAFLAVWMGKMTAESWALGRVLTSLKLRLLLVDFAKSSLLHPWYVLTVAVGAVRGKFEWKGRAN